MLQRYREDQDHRQHVHGSRGPRPNHWKQGETQPHVCDIYASCLPPKKTNKKNNCVFPRHFQIHASFFILCSHFAYASCATWGEKKRRFLLEPLTDGTACGLTYKTSHHLAQISCQSKHQRVLFHPYWPLGAVLKTLNVHAEFEYAHQNSHLWPLNGYIFPTQSSRVNTRIPSNRTLRQSVRIHSNIVTV